MLRSLVALLAFLIQWRLGACDQLYYWVDQSCGSDIAGVIGDALRMAAGASLRLSNAEGSQRDLFTRIFKAQPDDHDAATEVQRSYLYCSSANNGSDSNSIGVMGSIGTLRPSPDRPSSDIRIYCDNDVLAPVGRWSPVPDIPGDPYPNSRKRDGVDKEYEDVLNGLGRATDTMGCLDPGTQAETYYVQRNPQNTVANQNAQRSAITVRQSKSQRPYS